MQTGLGLFVDVVAGGLVDVGKADLEGPPLLLNVGLGVAAGGDVVANAVEQLLGLTLGAGELLPQCQVVGVDAYLGRLASVVDLEAGGLLPLGEDVGFDPTPVVDSGGVDVGGAPL